MIAVIIGGGWMTWVASRKIQCLKDQGISVRDDFPVPANRLLMAEVDG